MLGKGAKVVPNTLDQISILTRGFLADLGEKRSFDNLDDDDEDVFSYKKVAKKETEKILIAMVQTELGKRKIEGKYLHISEANLTSFGCKPRCSCGRMDCRHLAKD
ncbi:hypothetical protein GUJ93_ZPchr0013g33965 [Zizania palustris]|uniref:Uncharacterized protein n=1 Tax=Zizania palustris TaxID=103762 RepID=A0A8J5X4W2_ZIZPA|nr:hypothetical protein GUJ93_ZPchr0013g33965 [Zizania palustris]